MSKLKLKINRIIIFILFFNINYSYMSSINLTNINTLDRPDTYKKSIDILNNISIDLYNKLIRNKLTDKKINLYEYIDIKYIELNNFNGKFNFYYNFNEKINNIHYISIYKVIIPKYVILYREIFNNSIFNDYFLNNLNIIQKYNDYEYLNYKINIHNYIINNNDYIINYSIDFNFEINYEIIINNNNIINNYKYYIIKKINTQNYYPYINMSIDGLNDDFMKTTNDKILFNNLLPKTKINYIYYHNFDCDVIYPLSKLKNITNLNIKLFDYKNNDLFINYLNDDYYDYNVNNNCECIFLNNKTGCCCSYIRNRYNFISTIILRIGIIKNDILKNIIN